MDEMYKVALENLERSENICSFRRQRNKPVFINIDIF